MYWIVDLHQFTHINPSIHKYTYIRCGQISLQIPAQYGQKDIILVSSKRIADALKQWKHLAFNSFDTPGHSFIWEFCQKTSNIQSVQSKRKRWKHLNLGALHKFIIDHQELHQWHHTFTVCIYQSPSWQNHGIRKHLTAKPIA